ncbi:MAG: hypothetical protein LBF76_02805, partial [Holosporales bacterium]|nr:hypothetical protein [Holosporales bacterium]
MNFQINVLKLIYHEIGHALRWRAFGERNTYTLKIGSERTGGSNFFAYFVRKILQPMEDGATGYSQEEYSEFRERITKETAGPLLILSAGGLNNEVYLSEKETEMLHENGELHRGITLSEKNAIYG